MKTPGPNDFAMMEELLTRRLKRIDEDPEPDLIVIDGGKGQLGMVCGVLNNGLADLYFAIATNKGNHTINKSVRHKCV